MKQRPEIRDQGSENWDQRSGQLERLLRQALPPITDTPGSERDLWPAMRNKLGQQAAARSWLDVSWSSVPWFDWALLGILACLLAAFPAAIPLLLYYL